MYHYGGNNPIKYTDPTGEAIAVIPFIAPTVIAGAKAIGAWLGSLFVVGVAATAVGVTVDAAIDDGSTTPSIPILTEGEAPGIDAIPNEDKDKIAEHSHDGGHGPEVNLDNPSQQGIKDKIDEILTNPETQVRVRKKDNTTGYLAPDGTLLIHNPSAEDEGTIFYPDDEPQEYFENEFR